jgi:general secretion pathway protein M
MAHLTDSIVFNQLQNYYLNLSSRDQLVVKILSVFTLLMVIIFGLIVPANNYLDKAEKNYRSSIDQLQWMQQNKALVDSAAQPSVNRDTDQSLLGIANTSSKGFQISFKRYESVGENGLSLWMEGVAFNNLILWLERLDKRHGISIQEIAVERQENPGLVNVRLVLQG